MRIGIDVDDTITDTSEILASYATKHSNDYSDDNYLINNIDKMMRGFLDNDILRRFFTDYAEKIALNAKIKPDASKIINKLKDEGHEIYVITARSKTYFKDPEALTINYLKNHDIKCDKVITSKTFKSEVCKEEKIDIMFDDAIDTCESIKKEGIKAVVFNSTINLEKDTTCDRVNNWMEAFDYINNLDK